MKKTIMTLGMASAMMMPFTACEQAKHENPLLMDNQLPFGAPDFDKIEDTDYLPAFEAAIAENRQNIKAIVECPDSATFENTILALEESDRLLDRVSRTFFALTEADKTDEIADIEKKVMPMLTELDNEISFNQQLFERIRQVYDRDYDSLQGEDRKLLEEIYKQFVRKGALLPADKMARMKEINLRISDLQQPPTMLSCGLIRRKTSQDSLRPTSPSVRKMPIAVVERHPMPSSLSTPHSSLFLPASTTVSCESVCSKLPSIVPTA